ncbi:hypothetical protein PI859_21445 [Burkholderia pseudomallei]|uniref:hypothetical protein n=1 Tax=Burkholderia pseudomallei TaxID=28450 RepID=UPI0022FDF550|nr:hypothetical protein [Burkholderia pseudomallei]MDA5592643.1 hypothetical protein [Burkholderia pseudomallei]
MNMQTFLLYLLITVLMAPLLAVYGLPFIAVARGFSRIARARIGDRLRRAIACAIAAAGIALASFGVTWIVVMLVARLCTRRRAAPQTHGA